LQAAPAWFQLLVVQLSRDVCSPDSVFPENLLLRPLVVLCFHMQADGLPPSMAAVDLTTERLVAEVLQSADGIAAAAASSGGGAQPSSQHYSQQQQQRRFSQQQYNEQQQYEEQQPVLQQPQPQTFGQQQQQLRYPPASKVSPAKGLQAGALTAGGGRRHGKHAAGIKKLLSNTQAPKLSINVFAS
jgi:hypothetical protein